jgi:hypothetical protein
MHDPFAYSELYPQLFALVFGEKDFSGDYYWALMTNGLLRKTRQFIHETDVWNDALETPGVDLVRRDMSRAEFQNLVAEHSGQFTVGGRVREWLRGEPRGEQESTYRRQYPPATATPAVKYED